MYENTLFEPIYGNSDWGSALVAVIVIVLSVASAWVVGTIGSRIGRK